MFGKVNYGLTSLKKQIFVVISSPGSVTGLITIYCVEVLKEKTETKLVKPTSNSAGHWPNIMSLEYMYFLSFSWEWVTPGSCLFLNAKQPYLCLY